MSWPLEWFLRRRTSLGEGQGPTKSSESGSPRDPSIVQKWLPDGSFPQMAAAGAWCFMAGSTVTPDTNYPVFERAVSAWEDKMYSRTDFLFNFTFENSSTAHSHCLLFFCSCYCSSFLYLLPIKQWCDAGLARINQFVLGIPFFSKGAIISFVCCWHEWTWRICRQCPPGLSCEVSMGISFVLVPEGDQEYSRMTMRHSMGIPCVFQHPSWNNNFLANLQWNLT